MSNNNICAFRFVKGDLLILLQCNTKCRKSKSSSISKVIMIVSPTNSNFGQCNIKCIFLRNQIFQCLLGIWWENTNESSVIFCIALMVHRIGSFNRQGPPITGKNECPLMSVAILVRRKTLHHFCPSSLVEWRKISAILLVSQTLFIYTDLTSYHTTVICLIFGWERCCLLIFLYLWGL